MHSETNKIVSRAKRVQIVGFIVVAATLITVLVYIINFAENRPLLGVGEFMLSERMIPVLSLLIPALVSLFFICVLIPSPANKILVALDTLILWPIILIFVCLSYKRAVSGKPMMEIKENFKRNYSILVMVFIVATFGFFVLLSLMGFIIGVMMPFLKDKTYDLDSAKLISSFAILAFICSNAIATYFGLRRYHKRNETRV